MTVQRLAAATNRNSVTQKADIFLRLTQAYLFNLFLDSGDDNFQKVLPAGAFQVEESFGE